MNMRKKKIHPGKILYDLYMAPNRITTYRLKILLQIRHSHLSRILDGESGITANIALRLSRVFGTTP